MVATVNGDSYVRLYRLGDAPGAVAKLGGHTYRGQGACFSPCSRVLCTAAYDASVRIWSTRGSHPCLAAFFASGGVVCKSSSFDPWLESRAVSNS